MAKRTAGTDLNHDNWDQDEDQEQAGIFKKATETAMAGRVIKKAARKRVNPMAAAGGEEKKNAFASFGGFAAPTPAAGGGSDAFGFLKKGGTDSVASTGPISFGSAAANTSSFSFGATSKTEPAKSAAFSFGTSTAANNSTSSSFVFGSPSTKEPAKAGFAFGSPATSNKDSAVASPFSFGSSTTASSDASKSSGFVFGSSMAAKPTAAAQPTAVSGFSFGSKESTPLAAPAKKEEAVVKPVFGSPPAANGSSATTTGPAVSAPKGDLMAMFKPKTGTWSCDVCMISNPSDKTKCAACETPKPGSKPEANGSSNTTSVFGTSASSGAFKFGASGVDSGGGGGGGFQFGSGGGSSTTSTSVPSPVSGFKFGSGGSNAPAVGSKTESKLTSGFAFGDQKPAVATPEKKESAAFKISATDSKPSAGFSFGASSTPVNKPLNTSFGDKLSPPSAAINKDSSSKFSSSSDTMPAVKPTASTFSFGAKADNSNSSDSSSSKSNMAGFAATFGGAPKTAPSQEAGETEYNEDFLAHLQALNKQVTQWIQKHINENSYVILSPVFKDYEKHLKEITEKFPANKKSSAAIGSSFSSTSPSASAKLTSAASFMPSSSAPKFGVSATSPVNSAVKPFSFGSSTETSTPLGTTKTEAVKPFSFGSTAPASESKTEAVKPFSFGSTSDKSAAPAPGGFSFGMGAANPPAPPGGGFSFGPGMFAAPPGAGAINAPSAGDGAKEEDYEPPKAEVTTVEETDALYSKKCKLFYKKDGSYVEKGVGMLHLKSADNGKTQLVIRADTNLGNILLNIILNKDIPTTRVGKNNVMLVCVPNPPINPKEGGNEPVGMLIRVKSGEDADELKTKLDDYKSK